ncbi:MAG TPA: class I SAM-dependent methyltransferase [Burkholderiales bacterium]|nr:class I SAM-dependent methyltransferase [Burkholderiales bacterium]
MTWGRAAAALLVALPALSLAADQHPHADVPFVPTPPGVVDAMLGLAGIGPEDFVIDLGSGDGRIVIAAAKLRGARGTGVEIDGALVWDARREAQRKGVAGRVEFIEQSLFLSEIGQATVITMYLSPRLMMQLRPRLFAELKPGTRIVSHDFDMESWRPDARVTVPVPDKPYGPSSSEVYLWIIPANAAGAWRWRSSDGAAAVEYELTLSQTFQMLEGKALIGGQPGRLEGGGMRGAEIRLMLTAEVGGRTLRHEFSGRVDGDAISGRVKLPGGGELDWKATRVRRGSIQLP